MVDIKTKYDLKIGLKKLAISVGIVALAGFIAVYADDPKFLAIIPIAEFGLNWLKHRK